MLLIIFWVLLGVLNKASSFQFPTIKFVGISNDLNTPRILVQNGDDEAYKLLQRLENHCANTVRDDKDSIKDIQWYPNLEEGYDIVNVIFQEVERVVVSLDNDDEQPSIIISFPSMKRQDDLDKLARVLKSDKCKDLLCIENAFAELYPLSPSPYIHITFCTNVNAKSEVADYGEVLNVEVGEDTSVSTTKEWVNNFLGKFRLCPYTSSVSRAAVGLSSVGVPIGGVHVVKVDSTDPNVDKVKSQRAIKLVSAFWSEVVTLMQSNQDEWATSLVICPEYDTDFKSFADVCDSIIEPTVVATQSTEFIGRAWFHPLYNADLVGHSEVIAGHSVPHKMVQGFMQSLANDESILEYDEISKANNKVRQTPHATVNILRRSQLNAAAEYEKNLGYKRPKPNSIYVRNTRRLAEVIDDNI